MTREKLTNDEAIDYLKNIKDLYDCCYEEDALDMAISALSAPSANVISIDQANAMIKSYVSHYEEDKGEWIPVSERLPLLRGLHKISDDVLITNGFEIDMGYLVERNGKIFWHYYGSDYEYGVKDEDNDAIAWMPLPEPYKAKRGE